MDRLSAALAGIVAVGTACALAIPDYSGAGAEAERIAKATTRATPAATVVADAGARTVGSIPATGAMITGYVETIVDGDSLKLDGNRQVRLHGIDSVELHQTCDPGAWRCGHAAWGRLYGMVKDDRWVTCERKDTDRHGRAVAVCGNRGGDLGRRMVAQGWALAYRKYSTAYVDEEAAAKAGKLGIWRGGFVNPEEWRHGRR